MKPCEKREIGNGGIISQFAVIGAGTIINLIIGFITTPIITRMVDPDEYGMFSVFTMYSSIFVMVLCMGLDQSLVRFYYQNDSDSYKKSLLRFCFIVPFLLSIVLGFVIIIIQHYRILSFEFPSHITRLLIVFIVFSVWQRISILLLRIRRKSKRYAQCNILQKTVYVIISIGWVATVKSKKIEGLCIATILATVMSSIVATISSKDQWSFLKSPALTNKREVLKYGLPFILSMGLTTLFQAIDKISLNHYCSYEEVGIYSSAMSVVHIFAIIETTFSALWGPIVIERYTKDPIETKRFVKKTSQIIIVIMFFLGINLLLAKDGLVFMLGEKYRAASAILPFLIFNPIMLTISEITQCGISFSKRSHVNIFISLIACITNLLGNTILVPMFGGKGAAISTGISYIVYFAFRTAFSNKYYKVNYEIKKLIILLLCTLGFALYGTFNSISILSIIIYIICLTALFLLYKDYIIICIDTIVKELKKKKHAI